MYHHQFASTNTGSISYLYPQYHVSVCVMYTHAGESWADPIWCLCTCVFGHIGSCVAFRTITVLPPPSYLRIPLPFIALSLYCYIAYHCAFIHIRSGASPHLCFRRPSSSFMDGWMDG
jgi:hypothetical protein